MKDDLYYFHQTPVDLCRILIPFVPLIEGDKVLEPFKGEGGFYHNLPSYTMNDWCEITDGRDYLTYDKEIDWVVSNPPFKIEEKNCFFTLLKYYSTRVNKGIAFLGSDYCLGTLTPKRIKELQTNGLFIHSITVCSVSKWRGRYFWIICKKEPSQFFNYIEGTF